MPETVIQSNKTKKVLRTLATISAWALLAMMVVIVVTGWGITQTSIIYKLSFGLINRGVANSIHRAANIPLAFFFLTHVLINIKLASMKRSLRWQWLVNGVLIVVGIALMVLVVFMENRIGG
jgi:thiosulfate reductase cytochrome b subunit